MISNNSFIYNTVKKEENNLLKSFSFGKNDIITIIFDPEGSILFEKKE